MSETNENPVRKTLLIGFAAAGALVQIINLTSFYALADELFTGTVNLVSWDPWEDMFFSLIVVVFMTLVQLCFTVVQLVVRVTAPAQMRPWLRKRRWVIWTPTLVGLLPPLGLVVIVIRILLGG